MCRIKILFTVILIILILLHCNSCCLIGFGLGAVSDANKPDSKEIPVSQVSQILPGNEITIYLKNGSRISGIFLGYKPFSLITYREEYENFISKLSEEASVPLIGEKILINEPSQTEKEGVFLGFDKDNIYVLLPDYTLFSTGLNTITELSGKNGKIYFLHIIKEFICSERFPYFSEEKINIYPEIGLQLDRVIEYYSPEGIEQISIPVSKNGKITGFFLGAALDLVTLAVAFSTWDRPGFQIKWH